MSSVEAHSERETKARRDLLAELAARSSSLAERLNGAVIAAAEDTAEEVDLLLDRWAELVCDKDPERFRKRLDWDGLSLAELRRLLGRVNWNPDRPLPDWTGIVRSALEEAAAAPPHAPGSVPVMNDR